MIGVVADTFFGFSLILEGEGEGYFSSTNPGLLDECAELLGEDENKNLSLMTKVGNDSEGDLIKDWYDTNFSLDVTYYESKLYPTAVSIDAEMRYRYSALQDIREEEVLDFIDSKGVNTLIVAASLLSFKPVSREIVKAIEKRKEKLSYVIVDAATSYNILLLEELKENIESILESGLKVFMVGEVLSVEGVKKMSRDRRDELLVPPEKKCKK